MIKAINKNGTIGYFSEKVWNLMSKATGWEEYGGVKPIEIPEQIIEYQKSLKTKEVSEEEMKAFLDAKQVKYHHKIGYAKLKLLYDDYKK